MKKLVLLIVLLFFSVGCNAQENKAQSKEQTDKNMPKTNIIVNKEYDENGNLIRYDSTYSYFYSNVEGDSTFADSILTNFKGRVFESFPDVHTPFWNDMFFEDSLLTYDFYKDDFFTKRFEMNMKRFEKLFKEMDMFKNDFYEKYSKPKEKEKK
jgi:hypothetical protein